MSRKPEAVHNSRFKTENQALFTEARTLEELVEVVDERFEYYNCERRHSAIRTCSLCEELGAA